MERAIAQLIARHPAELAAQLSSARHFKVAQSARLSSARHFEVSHSARLSSARQFGKKFEILKNFETFY